MRHDCGENQHECEENKEAHHRGDHVEQSGIHVPVYCFPIHISVPPPIASPVNCRAWERMNRLPGIVSGHRYLGVDREGEGQGEEIGTVRRITCAGKHFFPGTFHRRSL